MNLKELSSQLCFEFTAELSWLNGITTWNAFNKLNNQPTDKETDGGKLYSNYHMTPGYTLELTRQGQRAKLKSFVVLVKE